jgi:hypothetical protein
LIIFAWGNNGGGRISGDARFPEILNRRLGELCYTLSRKTARELKILVPDGFDCWAVPAMGSNKLISVGRN